jgi:hypothetical protein
MSAEQIVRDFLSAFESEGTDAALPYLTEDMTVTTLNPPLETDLRGFVNQGDMILRTMPDFRWNVRKVTTQGNRVTVIMRWTGTHTDVLALSSFVPGAPDIPATGQRVSVPDTFIRNVSRACNNSIEKIKEDSARWAG